MIQFMPVVSHPYVEAPPVDTVICRFIDFDKFRDLFASEELYLRRTDLFKENDPWEALPSDEIHQSSTPPPSRRPCRRVEAHQPTGFHPAEQRRLLHNVLADI